MIKQKQRFPITGRMDKELPGLEEAGRVGNVNEKGSSNVFGSAGSVPAGSLWEQ